MFFMIYNIWQKKLNIAKIAFNFVQMEFLAMHITKVFRYLQ